MACSRLCNLYQLSVTFAINFHMPTGKKICRPFYNKASSSITWCSNIDNRGESVIRLTNQMSSRSYVTSYLYKNTKWAYSPDIRYYGHREKLRTIGRENDLERLNRTALRIAREVADETGILMAGGLSNTNIYDIDDHATHAKVREMFKEQVEWAVEEGADYIIAETMSYYGEAKLALEAIKQHGKGVPAVITFTCYVPDTTVEGLPIVEACRKLENEGAAVVGLNCGRGPRTMLPIIRKIRKACQGPIAAIPVTFRTTTDCPSYTSLKDPTTGTCVYPTNLSCVACSRDDIKDFAKEAKAIGVNYVGLCCGNAPFYFRELAEAYGRTPDACKYSPDVSANSLVGKSTKHSQKMTGFLGIHTI